MAGQKSFLDRVYWPIVYIGVSCTAISVVVRTLGVPLEAWLLGKPATVLLEVESVGVAALDAVGTRYGEGVVDVQLAAPSMLDRLWDVSPGVVALIATGLGAWLLLGLCRSFAAGEPFHAVNVRRLRGLSLVLTVGTTAYIAAERLSAEWLLDQIALGSQRPETAVGIHAPLFTAGLLVVMLTEVFARGRRISREVEGLV